MKDVVILLPCFVFPPREGLNIMNESVSTNTVCMCSNAFSFVKIYFYPLSSCE